MGIPRDKLRDILAAARDGIASLSQASVGTTSFTRGNDGRKNAEEERTKIDVCSGRQNRNNERTIRSVLPQQESEHARLTTSKSGDVDDLFARRERRGKNEAEVLSHSCLSCGISFPNT